MTEAELRTEMVRRAHALGWRVFSLPMAKTRRPVKDATGYPDLTLARQGRVVWLELKQEDGTLRPDQLKWLQELDPVCFVVRPSDLQADWLRLLLV